MLILTIKTDNPIAELGLFENGTKLQYKKWEAHRQLSQMILSEISSLLKAANKSWNDLQGIVIYKGPGSFTGLRISSALANALAYSYEFQIASTTGEEWLKTGIQILENKKGENMSIPEYGAPVHITKQVR